MCVLAKVLMSATLCERQHGQKVHPSKNQHHSKLNDPEGMLGNEVSQRGAKQRNWVHVCLIADPSAVRPDVSSSKVNGLGGMFGYQVLLLTANNTQSGHHLRT